MCTTITAVNQMSIIHLQREERRRLGGWGVKMLVKINSIVPYKEHYKTRYLIDICISQGPFMKSINPVMKTLTTKYTYQWVIAILRFEKRLYKVFSFFLLTAFWARRNMNFFQKLANRISMTKGENFYAQHLLFSFSQIKNFNWGWVLSFSPFLLVHY